MKIKRFSILFFTASFLFMNITSVSVVHAQALPTSTPDLHLLEPQLKEIRGNAYQHALEKQGFDLSYGSNALGLMGALDSLEKGTDFVFQKDEDYEAQIQLVRDLSTFPEPLKFLDVNIYMAKLDYADMKITAFLDENGKNLGNTIVEYNNHMINTVKKAVSSLNCNYLGMEKFSPEKFGLQANALIKDGISKAVPGTTVMSFFHNNNPLEKYEYCASYFQLISSNKDDIYFLAAVSEKERNLGIYSYIVCLTKDVNASHHKYLYLVENLKRPATFTQLSNGYDLDLATERKFTRWFPEKPVGGYYLFVGTVDNILIDTDFNSSGSISIPTKKENIAYSFSSPFPVLDLCGSEEIETWFSEDFNPKNISLNEHIPILLNPNTQEKILPAHGLNYDSLVAHNKAVSETVPKIEPAQKPTYDPFPNGLPLPENAPLPEMIPLPDNIPMYPPASLEQTVPDVAPAPVPDFDTSYEIETVPGHEPTEKPSEESDINSNITPISGLKDKFPFCVPFDLIDSIKGLVSTPETPVFKIPFKISRWGIDETIVLDFAPFENLAKISRWFSLLSFIVFLIILTRKIISN